MKQNFLFLLFFSFIISNLFSQKYIEVIADLSCECIEKIPAEIEPKTFKMKLGLCMLKASLPYKKQLKHDHKLNLDEMNSEVGEELGVLIASKMISKCPNILMQASQQMDSRSEEIEDFSEIMTGVITNVAVNDFVTLSLKNDEGKHVKFYWLTFVDSDFDLMSNYVDLKNKKVSIEYYKNEIFDPKIEEYRDINIIAKIDSFDENNLVCDDFYNGIFYISGDKNNSKILTIERNGISQLEYYNKEKEVLVYAIIEWKNNCSYRLFYDDTRMELDSDQKFVNDNGGLLIEKTDIIGKCLYYTSTLMINGTPMSMDGKICKK